MIRCNMAEYGAPPRILPPLQVVLKLLVTHVTTVVIDLAFAVTFGRNYVIPKASVNIVHNVVKLNLLDAELRWFAWLASVLK